MKFSFYLKSEKFWEKKEGPLGLGGLCECPCCLFLRTCGLNSAKQFCPFSLIYQRKKSTLHPSSIAEVQVSTRKYKTGRTTPPNCSIRAAHHPRALPPGFVAAPSSSVIPLRLPVISPSTPRVPHQSVSLSRQKQAYQAMVAPGGGLPGCQWRSVRLK